MDKTPFQGLTLGLQQTIDQAVTLFVPLLFHAILLSAAISVAIITSQDEININKTIAYLSVFCTFRPLGILIGNNILHLGLVHSVQHHDQKG